MSSLQSHRNHPSTITIQHTQAISMKRDGGDRKGRGGDEEDDNDEGEKEIDKKEERRREWEARRERQERESGERGSLPLGKL